MKKILLFILSLFVFTGCSPKKIENNDHDYEKIISAAYDEYYLYPMESNVKYSFTCQNNETILYEENYECSDKDSYILFGIKEMEGQKYMQMVTSIDSTVATKQLSGNEIEILNKDESFTFKIDQNKYCYSTK